MLLFGYLGETGVLSIGLSTVLGFIPFFIMFYIIYQTFVIYIPEAKNIFLYFVCVWGLYGIAALMPYNIKNASYNILDLFAKNFFGLFLAYTIYTKLKSNTNKNITNITNINNKNQIPIDKSL
jgi:bacteriorhodopsin